MNNYKIVNRVNIKHFHAVFIAIALSVFSTSAYSEKSQRIPTMIKDADQDYAIEILKSRGFNNVAIEKTPVDQSEGCYPDKVCRSEPAIGSKAPLSQKIAIYIGAEDGKRLPADLAGKTRQEAEQVLGKAGFSNVSFENISTEDERYRPRCYHGKVCGADPSLGTRNVPLSKNITVYIGFKGLALEKEDLTIIAALPGRETVGPMSPTWCELVPELPVSSNDNDTLVRPPNGRDITRHISYETMAPSRLVTSLHYMCINPDDENYRIQTGSLVQGWINLTGLGKDDAMASLSQRVQKDQWDKYRQQTCEKFTNTDAEASEEAKYVNGAMSASLGCGDAVNFWMVPYDINSYSKLEWYLDKRARLDSQLLTAYMARACFGVSEVPDENSPQALVKWATCSHDALALDLDDLEKELDDGGYNDYAKIYGKELVASTLAFANDFRKVVDALGDKDEAYTKILVDAPTTAWDKWVELYDDHKDAIEDANKFEDALFGASRSAVNGCRDTLRENFMEFIEEKDPTSVSGFEQVATDDIGTILLDRLAACEIASGNINHGSMYQSLLKKGRNLRGPRYAAYNAMIQATQEVKADRPRFPIETSMLWGKPRSPLFEAAWEKSGVSSTPNLSIDSKGIVKSTEKVSDGVLVTFKAEAYQAMEQRCVETDKIWRIDENLKIHYFMDCKDLGMKTYERKADPVVIPEETAEGIEEGVLAYILGDVTQSSSAQAWKGFPVSAYADEGRGALLSAYGFPIEDGEKGGGGAAKISSGSSGGAPSTSLALAAGSSEGHHDDADSGSDAEGGVFSLLFRLITVAALLAAGLIFGGGALGDRVPALTGIARAAQQQSRIVALACLGIGVLQLLGGLFVVSLLANLLPMLACLLAGLVLYDQSATDTAADGAGNTWVAITGSSIRKLAVLARPLGNQRTLLAGIMFVIAVLHLVVGKMSII